MLRTAIVVVTGIAACVGAVYGARTLRRNEDAQKLALEARYVLEAPMSRAPELTRIEAGRARALLDEALSLQDTPESRGLAAWAKGLALYQKGELDRARTSAAEAARLLPGLPSIDVLLAAIEIAAGDRTRAEAHLHWALSADSKHARARLLSADLAADSGQTDAALAMVDALIAEQPRLGTLYNRRGLLRESSDALDAAARDFEQAATLDAELVEPHLNLGRLMARRGRMSQSEQAFARALRLDESAPQAWLGRGLARLAQGDGAGARLDLERARELAPAEPDPLIALGDHAAQYGALADAVPRYRAATTLAPGNTTAWLKLGNALIRVHDYAEARSAFERALALDTDLAQAHNGLGAALMGAGEHEAAQAEFAFAAALDQRDPNPLLNLALLHKKAGNLRAAKEAREAAAERAAL